MKGVCILSEYVLSESLVLDSSPGYFAGVPTGRIFPKLGLSVKTERTRVGDVYFGLIVIVAAQL